METDHRLQAAYALINELTMAKLELISHALSLEEKLKAASEKSKEPEVIQESPE